MSDITQAGSPAPRSAIVAKGVGFLALWVVLMGPAPKDLPIGVAAAAAATWASLHLWPPGRLMHALPLARFFLRFLVQSVVAGVQVARYAFAPTITLRPGFTTYRTTLPAGMARSAGCAVMSLQPGKLPVAADADGVLHIHCLDLREPAAEQIAADEAAFLGILHREDARG